MKYPESTGYNPAKVQIFAGKKNLEQYGNMPIC